MNGLLNYGDKSSVYTIQDRDRILKGFHHYEKFNEQVQYEPIVNRDFGHGCRKYEQYLRCMRIVKDDFYETHQHCVILSEVKEHEFILEKWVIVNEWMTNEELDALVPYCQCALCTAPFFMMGMIMGTLCNYNEHYYGGPNVKVDQINIDEAREFKAANPHFLMWRRIRRSMFVIFFLLLLYTGYMVFFYICSFFHLKK